MFQVIAKRHEQKGYHIHLSDIPEELKEDSIVFMPEISTREIDHLKYVSKYTHKSGNIIVKLVRSDGYDPFNRPKSLSHNLIIPSEEYNVNSLMYYTSPIIYTNRFDDIEDKPKLLENNDFRKYKNNITDIVDLKVLREILVAVMTEPKVFLQLDLEFSDILQLSSLFDKSIPYEASFDFSLITYSDRSSIKHLVHNLVYALVGNSKNEEKVIIKNTKSSIKNIAYEERKYLNEYIELILKEDYENILQEHAKWFIGMHYNDHRKLQKLFTQRYQLNIPFSRRHKFHARLVKSLSKFDF